MSATMKSTTPPRLAQLLQALERARVDFGLEARAQAQRAPFDAGQLIEIEVGEQRLAPAMRAPTASRRASVLLPTPPFWLTKDAVTGIFGLLIGGSGRATRTRAMLYRGRR